MVLNAKDKIMATEKPSVEKVHPTSHSTCERMACIDRENNGEIEIDCSKCTDQNICIMASN